MCKKRGAHAKAQRREEEAREFTRMDANKAVVGRPVMERVYADGWHVLVCVDMLCTSSGLASEHARVGGATQGMPSAAKCDSTDDCGGSRRGIDKRRETEPLRRTDRTSTASGESTKPW
jgi:hypothetical protein